MSDLNWGSWGRISTDRYHRRLMRLADSEIAELETELKQPPKVVPGLVDLFRRHNVFKKENDDGKDRRTETLG